jgi:alkylated DNA repair dioxygenase AlkB
MDAMQVLLKTEKSRLLGSTLPKLLPDFDIATLRSVVKGLPFHERPDIVVMGKKYKQPRDVVFLSDVSAAYDYANQKMPAIKFGEKFALLKQLLDKVNAALKSDFNGILVNRYNNGNDCVGAHHDDERTLDAKVGVFSLSLGQRRTFRVKERTPKNTSVKKAIAKIVFHAPGVRKATMNETLNRCDVDLNDLDVVIMDGECQKELDHEITREARVTGVRWNLTFRHHTS